jgi:hypothetical protein
MCRYVQYFERDLCGCTQRVGVVGSNKTIKISSRTMPTASLDDATRLPACSLSPDVHTLVNDIKLPDARIVDAPGSL